MAEYRYCREYVHNKKTKLNILIVDDDENSAELFKNALLKAPLYKAGKILTFYKAVQVGAAPLRIELVVRNPEFFGQMQYAFFENVLRKDVDLKSTPVEFKSRTKKAPVI